MVLKAAGRVRAVRIVARRLWGRLIDRVAFHDWDEGAVLMVFGGVIGVAVGLGVVGFYRLVDLAYQGFATLPASRLGPFEKALYRPLLTAAGLWVAWALVRRSHIPDGQNVPDVQLAVAKRGGDVPVRPVAVRTVASAVTLGSGGSGGVFTPTLFVGATLGTGLGLLMQLALPGRAVNPVAWGLVGMAGLVAGANRAPITAIFMVFEITDDYGLVLPLMMVSVLAYATSRRLTPYGLYDGWLAARNETLAHGADHALMERIPVARAVDRTALWVLPDASLAEVVEATGRARQLALPVVDDDGALLGVIHYPDLRAALMDRGDLATVLVAADLAEPIETADPAQTLRDALRTMNSRAYDTIPVVEAAGGGRYLGMLSRADLLAAYERELLEEV